MNIYALKKVEDYEKFEGISNRKSVQTFAKSKICTDFLLLNPDTFKFFLIFYYLQNINIHIQGVQK